MSKALADQQLRAGSIPRGALAEDPKWELAILATVQGFYEKLLQAPVQGEVPVPQGLEAISLQDDNNVHETLTKMRRWLRLLDMAITPAMLRRAFTADTDPEIAEAMLRYFTRTKMPATSTGTKLTSLPLSSIGIRAFPASGSSVATGSMVPCRFRHLKCALLEILADTDVPSLPEEHVQLLRRFDPLQDRPRASAI